MESFPFNKYRFIITNNQIIAISTYAGKTVKGVAKVDPRDKMDIEFGKKLAAARCNAKVAKRRHNRAIKKIVSAQMELDTARKFYNKMSDYYNDSEKALSKANIEVEKLINSLN